MQILYLLNNKIYTSLSDTNVLSIEINEENRRIFWFEVHIFDHQYNVQEMQNRKYLYEFNLANIL